MNPSESEKSAAEELFQAQAHIYNTTFNFMSSMALKSAVQLGIPDAIQGHGKPITLPQLVAALHIPPEKSAYLYRLMRLLIHSGFFAAVNNSESEEAYVLSPPSKLLVKDNNSICLSPFLMFVLQPDFVMPCQLGDWIKDDPSNSFAAASSPFEKTHGMKFYEYNDRNPEFNALFNDALAADSGTMKLVVENCGKAFEGIDSLVDVGGGTGTSARIIAKAFQGIKCKVLEVAKVVVAASPGDVEFVVGDMFQHVPSADAVLLKSMLHGWEDKDCVKILKKCKEAISSKAGERGKVMIIDIVLVNEKKDEVVLDRQLTGTKLLFDMFMMLVVNGMERSEKEWERLFFGSRFQALENHSSLWL